MAWSMVSLGWVFARTQQFARLLLPVGGQYHGRFGWDSQWLTSGGPCYPNMRGLRCPSMAIAVNVVARSNVLVRRAAVWSVHPCGGMRNPVAASIVPRRIRYSGCDVAAPGVRPRVGLFRINMLRGPGHLTLVPSRVGHDLFDIACNVRSPSLPCDADGDVGDGVLRRGVSAKGNLAGRFRQADVSRSFLPLGRPLREITGEDCSLTRQGRATTGQWTGLGDWTSTSFRFAVIGGLAGGICPAILAASGGG